MSDTLTSLDHYLAASGPAALVIREPMESVEGSDGVIFPATFAAAENSREFAGGYNIDRFEDGSNICLIDSVGSQANRIEPIFDAREEDGKYEGLTPQVRVTIGQDKSDEVSLFKAGHRAGDALVRCSQLAEPLQQAFQQVQHGDARDLAKIAPTSLVFGVWDSRDTQAKLPRLITSTVRAFNVKQLHRSAQFVPAVEYVDRGLLPEPSDKKSKDAYSERGFIHVPAAWSHGGVIAEEVRREATLSLSALRHSCVAPEAEPQRQLQRYILGLALVAFTYAPTGYLRQGCNLVHKLDGERTSEEVHGDGRRTPFTLSHEDAIAYARAAAEAFGVGEDRIVPFEQEKAKKDAKSKKK